MNKPVEPVSLPGKTVYQSINAVQADLASKGIGKDSTNTFDNYKFRGIDAVYNALSPLLAKHGLCILPRMLSRSCEERLSQKGGALFYVTVEAEFDFVSAHDGSKHTVKTYGEAMDRGDKATNKAMSAAYKYAAFQAFAIPTEGDNDADASTHEVAVKKRPTSVARSELESMSEEEQQFLRDLADSVTAYWPDEQATFDAYVKAKANLDTDEQTAFWALFDSKQRSAIKRIGAQELAGAM